MSEFKWEYEQEKKQLNDNKNQNVESVAAENTKIIIILLPKENIFYLCFLSPPNLSILTKSTCSNLGRFRDTLISRRGEATE